MDAEKLNTLTQHGAVTSVGLDIASGWSQLYLLTSDCHFDSVLCNREIMQEHFDKALAANARINIFGDWFDAMQGRFDPRRSYEELRPEYRYPDYYDRLVNDSAAWLKPYANLIDVMSDGNHELAVLKNANTNIMDRLVGTLRRENPECQAVHGGYGGWIRYMFNLSDGNATGPRRSVKLKYFHGAGGDAPVTRGVVHTNRHAVYLPDANIVVNGHSHNAYYVPIERERISNKGELFFDIQHHIRIPGYKQNYADGSGGWDVTRGAPPKPLGAFWARLYHHARTRDIGIQILPELSNPDPVHLENEQLYTGMTYSDDNEEE